MAATLTPDELLTTTRAVRKRLDLTKSVDRKTIEECISIASQAPNAGNAQSVHFLVVTDPERRASLAALYRRCSAGYFASRKPSMLPSSGDPVRDAAMERKFESELYLNEHLHEVPVHVIPCIIGRTDGLGIPAQAALWGSVYPAAWSFMLAGRVRGLAMTFTTIHLRAEEEAAGLLGIPFKEVMQAGLLPVAHAKGTRFRRGLRRPVSELAHWERW